ncbi:hypothetical protein N5D_25960 [Enterococcus faecalis]|nr:hypothetical protein N5D_25960 [Enterococcus faecalis]
MGGGVRGEKGRGKIPALRQQVEEVILDLRKQGMTQIVVTHDMAFAEKIADNLLTVAPVQ